MRNLPSIVVMIVTTVLIALPVMLLQMSSGSMRIDPPETVAMRIDAPAGSDEATAQPDGKGGRVDLAAVPKMVALIGPTGR